MPRPFAGARRCWLALVMVSLPTSPAYAHTSLRRSEPSTGARLSVAPTRIALWFTERPQVAFSKVNLLGPAGEIPLGALTAASGNELRVDISGALSPGEYMVRWQTASADGHVAKGDFRFVVLTPGADSAHATRVAPAAPPGGTPPHTAAATAHEGHEEYRTARWFEFVALLTVLGALGFRHGVLPPLAVRGVPTSDAGERARRFGTSALLLYVVAALVRVYNESVAVHGRELALQPSLVMPMLTSTIWGMGWLFGVIGAVLLAIGWAISRRTTVLGTPLALTGALGMVMSPALSGHAASSAHFVIGVVADVLHVAAAGLWLGALLMVVFAGIPAMRRIENGKADVAASALVNSFHPVALFCAPLVVLTGVANAWLRLGTVSALWQTDYGMTLIRKTVLVSFVLVAGAYNSSRARHRLAEHGGARRIVVSGSLELLFAAAVLAITTVLVTQPVPSATALPIP